jgi:PPOX class probable F420-dependent enzyme
LDIPDNARPLLEKDNLASFVTLMRDGSPQVTPVWVDHDGSHLLINTARGRQKDLNLQRDSRVAVLVIDHDDGFHYVQLRGSVVEVVDGEPAWDHIDRLCLKYRGQPKYPRRPGEERLLLKIQPEHVTVNG